jgi:alcohol sulfotransferase
MRALEDRGDSLMRSGRLKVENDPNRYKARRAKVGGYRNDFSADEIAAIDRLIDTGLAPVFGYARATSEPAERPAEIGR